MAEIVLLRPDQLAERERPKGRLGRRRSEERTRIIESYKEMMRDAVHSSREGASKLAIIGCKNVRCQCVYTPRRYWRSSVSAGRTSPKTVSAGSSSVATRPSGSVPALAGPGVAIMIAALALAGSLWARKVT